MKTNLDVRSIIPTSEIDSRAGRKAALNRSGFALIMALGLMALMVLLLASLTALVSVEVTAGQAYLDRALAQQNALVGLMQGVAALQATAGPDQRVTATADILSSTAASNKAWTGVWNSDGVDGYATASAQWLVSGARPNPATEVPLPTAGNQSIILRSAFTDLDGATQAAVRVPKMPLSPAQDLTSGGTANATLTPSSGNSGFYAYWVSDEGVKAKVNIAFDSEAVDTSTYASAILPRANGIQFLPEMSGMASVSAGQLSRVSTLGGLNFLLDNDGVGKRAQADLTTDSVGLLTDTRWGGLKIDLTAGFDSDSIFNGFFKNSDAQRNFFLLYYTADRLGISDLNKFKEIGPRLSLLRDYARFYKNLDSSGRFHVAIDASISDNAGGGDLSQYARVLGRLPYAQQKTGEILSQFVNDRGRVSFDTNKLVPSIASFQFGFRFRPNVAKPYTDSKGEVAYPLQVESQLFVGFYNPYNVTLSMTPPSGTSYLRFQSVLYPYVQMRVGHTDESGSWVTNDYWADGNQHMQITGTDNDQSNYAHQSRFASIVIPPGQIRIYGVADRSSATSTMSNSFDPNAYQINPNNGSMSVSSSITSREKTALRVREGDTIEIVRASPVPPPNYAGWRLMADYQQRFSLTTQGFLFFNSLSPIWYTNLREDYNAQTWQSISRAPAEVSRMSAAGEFNFIDVGSWGFNMRHTRSDFASRVIFDNNIRCLYSTSFSDKTSAIKIPSLYEFSEGDSALGTPLDTWGYVSLEGISPPQISGTSGVRSWWGNVSPSSITGGSGADTIILFDMAHCPPLSVGTFQHANLALYASEPSYVAGNSYANRRIEQPDLFAKNNGEICVYDIAWLVNDALWDTYFFSGLAREAGNAHGVRWDSWNNAAMLQNHVKNPTHYPLPNPRLYIEKSLSDGDVAAADFFSESSDNEYGAYRNIGALLRVNGPFNVNSTSTLAWKALLMSMNAAQLPVLNPTTGAITTSSVSGTQTAFARMAFSGGEAYSGGMNDNFWKGYRVLTENEATLLAKEIVAQVRKRGPFRSMADFVNRRLVSGETGQSGALQSAIDAAKLNDAVPSNYSANPKSVSGWDNAPANTKTGDGFPGAIMQGDILQGLAPVLSARSDTFRIRAYGDVVSPDGGTVTARAYCEAVVQRLPDYVDDAASGGEESYKGTRSPEGYEETLSDLNSQLGRRFKIIAIRWLNSNEI